MRLLRALEKLDWVVKMPSRERGHCSFMGFIHG